MLGAPYFGVTHHWYYGLRPERWTKLSAPVVPWLYKGKLFLQLNRKTSKPEVYSYTWIPTRGVLTLMEIGRRANAPDVLDAIQCPVLWLHSTGDVAASRKAAERAFQAMPSEHKRAVELTRSNHHIFWDYEQEQVFSEILKFLQNDVTTEESPSPPVAPTSRLVPSPRAPSLGAPISRLAFFPRTREIAPIPGLVGQAPPYGGNLRS